MTKRFYTMVSSKKTDEGFAIQLDGKTVQTPSKLDLVAPSQALADAITVEWSEQVDTIKPDTMPLTQILTTSIDKIRDRDAITEQYFAILHIMTSLSGSLILALAFVEGDISPEEIFEASYLEELYKAKIYDEDKYGASPEEQAERDGFKRDTQAARTFIDLTNEL